MQGQPEASQSFREHIHHATRIILKLEADDKVSNPEESHLRVLSEPDLNVSAHPAPIIQPPALSERLCFLHGLLPFRVDSKIELNDAAPLLHSHYKSFNTTTGCSAPVPRIGTLLLVGPPLGVLPSHRSDRFPRSTQEPEPRSRRLNAGRHPGHKQALPGLILGNDSSQF